MNCLWEANGQLVCKDNKKDIGNMNFNVMELDEIKHWHKRQNYPSDYSFNFPWNKTITCEKEIISRNTSGSTSGSTSESKSTLYNKYSLLK